MNRFRRKRFGWFFQFLEVGPTASILDVGGLAYDWITIGYHGEVTCVSLSHIREGKWGKGNITYMKQNATALPYPDQGFEIVYSNSLLEHVGRSNQTAVANEIRRVARRYWVQVPNRNFPLEPHYRALFFYQMPPRLRQLVATYWTPMVTKHNHYLAEVNTIYPLDRHKMQVLFPEAIILEEKLMGLTKSVIAAKK